MYTFAEADYKWCPQCAGNIRVQATRCRYCHKPIENRLLKDSGLPPFVIVRDAVEWLPTFTELREKCPAGFRERMNKAASEAPTPISSPMFEQGLPPKEIRCLSEPPHPELVGLLFDVLLCLYESGESLSEICQEPRLKLIEITPQEIVAEHELRKEEMQKGHKCRYCQEYLMTENEECRFCGGSEGKAPAVVDHFFEKEPDLQLLKDVILYEAAWRKLNDADAVPQEITDKNACTPKDIENEILRQQADQHVMPMPRFTRRMVELGLASFYTPEQMCLQAFCELGRALDSQKTNRADEALIVYDHALRRTEGLDELMHDRGRVLSGMATYYLREKDDAKYKLYNKMSQECEKFGMTDAMKDFMDKSQASLENMFKGEVETDPEKILANLDTHLEPSSRGMMGELLDNMGETIPGLGEMFANLTAGLDETKKTSRLVLEAAVAKKNGNLDEASSKYTEALERTEKFNRISGPNQRISILCSLAEIKQKQGDEPAAESLLKDALAAAEEYVEATPSLGKSSLWNALVSYADFLKNAGRFEEAEQNYQLALTVHEECTDSFLERHGCQRSDFSGTLAHIKERYAQLLRVTKRDSEAEKIEAEAVGHKQEAEDRQTEIKARRERLNPEQ